MLDRKRIRSLFKALNAELRKTGVIGEIGICGGAGMCLVFEARKATKDISAVFRPTQEIRKAAKKVAQAQGLPSDWLNDAAKAYFHADPPQETVLELDHLRVWAPRADYMLAMKCIAARFDTHDRDDVIFLIKYLELKQRLEVFSLIEKYYPRKLIPPKTQFLIEEILGD